MLILIGNILGQFFAYFSAYTLGWKNKLKKVKSEDTLVILPGHLGNALIDIEAIVKIGEYNNKNAKKTYLLCSKRVWNFCKYIQNMINIEFIDADIPDVDTGATIVSFLHSYYIIKKYQFDTVIITLSGISMLLEYIGICVPHNKLITVRDNIKAYKGVYRKLWKVMDHFYTHIEYCDPTMYQGQRLKKVLSHLGINGYNVSIHKIKKDEDTDLKNSITHDKYVTIALDSLQSERRWSSRSFAQITDEIIKKFNYIVVFTGGKEAEKIYSDVIHRINNPDKVISTISETTCGEWIEILRNAQFHVGIDSGSIHIAASVGTQAFALCGLWDGERCLPYDLDYLRIGTKEPICIFPEESVYQKCKYCHIISKRFGYGNSKCWNRCKNGDICLCADSIDVDRVLNEIEKWKSNMERLELSGIVGQLNKQW